MSNSRSANGPVRQHVIAALTMVAIGVVLAAMGPFGSYAIGGFARRLAYWVPLALLGWALFQPTINLMRAAAARLDLPDWLGLVAAVLVAAAPLTLLVLWWNGHRLGPLPPFENWFALYLNVALIGAMVTLLFWGIERAAKGRPAPITSPAPDVSPAPAASAAPRLAAFLSRLPPGFGAPVALEMEDHYVRAHGACGSSTLILMRMADAERELDGVEGLRIHRSWWVAREAVERVIRDGRKLSLRLTDGRLVPVARDRAAALRQAGWL